MICSILTFTVKISNIFGGLYITQTNIYDGAFVVKIVRIIGRLVYSQKNSVADARLRSKYASALHRFCFFKGAL